MSLRKEDKHVAWCSMRILVLAFRNPALQINGTAIRTYNMSRLLARVHDVDILFVDAQRGSGTVEADMAIFGHVSAHRVGLWHRALNITRALFTGEAIQLHYFQCPDVRHWIRQHRTRYDAAMCFHIRMAPYLDDFPGWRVIDMIDATSLLYRQGRHHAPLPWKWIYAWEQETLQRAELRAVNSFDRVIISSAYDRDYLLSLGAAPRADRISVCPNGVDEHLLHAPIQHTEDRVVFVGNMKYPPNFTAVIRFCKECWPAVRHAMPQANFFIVGHSPPATVRGLGRIPGVHVTGFVDDPSDYLTRAAVVVAPLTFTAGIQNKVLEAMAAGKPVVASPVAVRGIEGKPGTHYVVASNSEETAAAVVDLLGNPTRRRSIGTAARDLVCQRYRWELQADVVLKAFAPATRPREPGHRPSQYFIPPPPPPTVSSPTGEETTMRRVLATNNILPVRDTHNGRNNTHTAPG